ncbi:MAG TPA: S53 family peptidase [Candidatus Acidoferrum sp.]|jgi:subtilase family serine protease|nr:S53 family peptidase [Candidatus Acidoferrum sp.]
MRLRRLGLSLSVIAALAAAAFGAAPVSASNQRHALPGTKPSWTSVAPRTANVGGGLHGTAQVWLTPRNGAALDSLAAAVSDPSNAQYGHFLTAPQYRQLFAPTSAQLSAITQWLTASGLHIDSVGADNAYVAVSGTAASMNAAFGTKLAVYKVNGKLEQAPSQDVSVPDAVADTVTAVTGLTTFGHRLSPADLGSPAGFRNTTPCSSFYGQQVATTLPQFNGQTLPYSPCGYVPSQFRSVYGVPTSGAGAGQTVAITDAFDSPRLQSDANQYASNRGDSAFAAGQFQDMSVPECTTLTGLSCAQLASDCGGNGWYSEQNLDVEAVHGMAPSASVLYYGAGSCYDNDLLAALAQVVSDNKASIVTNSWGEPTFVQVCDLNGQNCQIFATIDQNEINAYENVFKRGAVQGIGFYFSSGDSGDELANTGVIHPDWPTGDTWVTSVGGTSLAIAQNGSRSFETGWGTSQWRLNAAGTAWTNNIAPFQYGAGGGFSQIFKEPGWQKKVVKNDPTGGRAVPDIAMDADPTTGMLIGITQSFADTGVGYGEYRIGGTSLASPLFAGLQADAQSGRGRIGFASPLIYALYHGNSNVYYDVTPQGDQGNIRSDFINSLNAGGGIRYTVRTFDQDSSLTTGRGWDDVTGVGSPTGAYIKLVNHS